MPQLVDSLKDPWPQAAANVRAAATRLWAVPTHRHVIDHGLSHADRVVALLDGLTEGLMSRKEHALAPEEIYILLAAAYLHAIGLQDEQSEPEPAARLARYPEIGAEMIYRAIEAPDETVRLGLVDDPGLVEMIARVVAHHHETGYSSPDYDDFDIGDAKVRPRLLTALLHLADSLDLDYRRVDLEQLKLTSLSLASALDWWLHHYVSAVRVEREYVRVSYRVPQGQAAYEETLPELIEGNLRTNFALLQDTFRQYDVRPGIGSSAIQQMRAVKPMPAEIWAAAEVRLARLRGIKPEPAPLSPLVDKVRGLLATMGYACEAPACSGPFTCFSCKPQGGGLRSPLMVGCKAGPAEVADVQALAVRFDGVCQQGYVVAETRVLPTALDAARSDGRIKVFTLAEFYNELLDFRAYVNKLIDAYAGSELARYYVDLGCVRRSYDDQGQITGQDSYKPVDDYVDLWLKESGEARNHISILGDYGAGKTSFCRQYAARQGRRWLADPERERIPLLINLRDYTKTLKVESLITDALVNQYNIQGARFEAFARYNADGKLLIFFDGFDEMAQRSGLRTAVDNFWELARVVTPGSKVILTCRTPYFRTHHEAEVLLRGQQFADASLETGASGGKDYIDLRDRPNFEIVHLEPFSDADIQTVLKKRFPEAWKRHWEQIQQVYNLHDLAQRPVLLDMIARTLPKLREGQTINAARLYQVYTDFWLERDVKRGRVLISPADRRLFAEELAMEMLRTEELSIHYSRLPGRVKAHFRLDKADEIDYFDADVRTCNFMSRDEGGNYAFAHKSFFEFFAACRLHRRMLEDKATANGAAPINEGIRQFLNGLFALAPKQEPGPPCAPPEGFVWVPPGEFIMGGESGSRLQITRLEQGFFAARTPVTNGQYARFVAETGHAPPGHWQGKHPPDKSVNHPVVNVNWHDATAYAKWAGGRLPTNEEWERATRGYDGREYPWGEWATGRCNSVETGIKGTSPVGQFSPEGDSLYGLQDAAGNVYEWTVAKEESWCMVRGGAFNLTYRDVRCASRLWLNPVVCHFIVGLRVVVACAPG